MKLCHSALLSAALSLALTGVAPAQAFPTAGKPVGIIVPFPAGGQTDAQARAIGQIAAAAETRYAALPDLPTMREQGYDVGMWGYLWF